MRVSFSAWCEYGHVAISAVCTPLAINLQDATSLFHDLSLRTAVLSLALRPAAASAGKVVLADKVAWLSRSAARIATRAADGDVTGVWQLVRQATGKRPVTGQPRAVLDDTGAQVTDDAAIAMLWHETVLREFSGHGTTLPWDAYSTKALEPLDEYQDTEPSDENAGSLYRWQQSLHMAMGRPLLEKPREMTSCQTSSCALLAQATLCSLLRCRASPTHVALPWAGEAARWPLYLDGRSSRCRRAMREGFSAAAVLGRCMRAAFVLMSRRGFPCSREMSNRVGFPRGPQSLVRTPRDCTFGALRSEAVRRL